jgi:hypothetical protein
MPPPAPVISRTKTDVPATGGLEMLMSGIQKLNSSIKQGNEKSEKEILYEGAPVKLKIEEFRDLETEIDDVINTILHDRNSPKTSTIKC